MKKLKILYIANGNSIHDLKWISYFSEQEENYSCYLLCDTLCELSEDTKLAIENSSIQLVKQINPISIKSPMKTWKAIRHYKKLVKDIEPDVIHVLFATPNALWLNFSNTPGVITMRGSDILLVIPALLNQVGVKSSYFTFLFRQFNKAFLKANLVTGTSFPQIEKATELFNGANLTLVRTGVEVEKINLINQNELIPNFLREKEFVFSPRFMAPIYNIGFQLDAISKLDRKIIERFTFVFIRGKQFDEEYFQIQLNRLIQLKAEINLSYHVIDYLDQPSMWMFLKKASLCLMTPISDGTPNSALEAMAAKCPLVISNLNYDKDLFENTCVKLKSFDVEELVEVIEASLLHYDLVLLERAYQQVLAQGNRTVEMEKMAQAYNSSR
jgi:glycosyltransferase involved in cell wall biosynthesis